MKVLYRNFGYHQLIEKRDIPLDKNVRKPKVLLAFEMLYLLAAMIFGLTTFSLYSASSYKAALGVGALAFLYIVAAYFSAVESRGFVALAIVASVLLGVLAVLAWHYSSAPILLVVVVTMIALIHVGVLVFSSKVASYSKWVSGNGN